MHNNVTGTKRLVYKLYNDKDTGILIQRILQKLEYKGTTHFAMIYNTTNYMYTFSPYTDFTKKVSIN